MGWRREPGSWSEGAQRLRRSGGSIADTRAIDVARAASTCSMLVDTPATLELAARGAAAALLAKRAALVRQQDTAVRLAEEQARPVKKEKRLAAVSASFGMQSLGSRIGKKYQIDVTPLSHWDPAGDEDEDEHDEPTLVPTEEMASELAAACDAAGNAVHAGRSQEEEEYVVEYILAQRYVRKKLQYEEADLVRDELEAMGLNPTLRPNPHPSPHPDLDPDSDPNSRRWRKQWRGSKPRHLPQL